MSRGAPKAPITYEGEYDPTRTYLPRQIAHVTAGATRTGYLSTATTTGDDPATSPTIWLPLGGGGGDSEHNGTGTNSTAVGTGALASGASSTSLGDAANASAARTVAIGHQAYAHVAAATAIGDQSEAAGDGSVAVGSGTYVGGDRGIAIGNAASSDSDSIAIGDRAEGGAGGNVVLGPVARATSTAATTGGCVIAGAGATSSAARTVAIGNAAHVTHADTGKIKVDTLEVESSSAAGVQTSVILTDSAGTRWLIGVDTGGNPVGLGAA